MNAAALTQAQATALQELRAPWVAELGDEGTDKLIQLCMDCVAKFQAGRNAI